MEWSQQFLGLLEVERTTDCFAESFINEINPSGNNNEAERFRSQYRQEEQDQPNQSDSSSTAESYESGTCSLCIFFSAEPASDPPILTAAFTLRPLLITNEKH